MIYHAAALFFGFVLDLLIGDPYWLPHPVRFIGKSITFFEERLLGSKKIGENTSLTSRQKKIRGGIEVVLVVVCVELPVVTLLILSYRFSAIAGCILETIMTYQLLATKCLKVESMKVYKALKTQNLEASRCAVSMIVGRETKNLTETEVIKAAVETVAENTSDGIIAPLLFLFAGGPVLGFFYKCINTMDSMIGYKNERYEDFGMVAAKTDDFVNFIPSRISAVLMIVSCSFLGKEFSAKNAFRIWKRDRLNHESPNSAQTESCAAGALGIKLAGPAVYEGKLEQKQFLGDDLRPVEKEDIVRINRLLYATAFLCEIICLLFLSAIIFNTGAV